MTWSPTAIVLGLLLGGAIMIWWLRHQRSSTYPDGRCYLCRRGRCQSGETCPLCAAQQPLLPGESLIPNWVVSVEEPGIEQALAAMHKLIDEIDGVVAYSPNEIRLFKDGQQVAAMDWPDLAVEFLAIRR